MKILGSIFRFVSVSLKLMAQTHALGFNVTTIFSCAGHAVGNQRLKLNTPSEQRITFDGVVAHQAQAMNT
jgi:hypothetical protein